MNSGLTIDDKIRINRDSPKSGIRHKGRFHQKVIQDELSFLALEPEWNRLAAVSEQTLYMSFEWVESWWNHFGKNRQRTLHIIAVYVGDRLVALLPFYKGYSSLAGLLKDNRLQLIGSGGSPNEQFGYSDDYGISDFLDFLVDPDYRNSVADFFLKEILPHSLPFDTITFHQAREDSYVKQYIYPGLADTGMQVEIDHTDTCPYINLENAPDLDSFVKGVKSNARRRFRQTLRATGPDEEFVIEEPENLQAIEQATDSMIDLHQKRWNELGFPGVFYDERFVRFFKDIIRISHQKGWLWFKETKDSKGISASRMLILYNGRYFDYISGFDDSSPSSKYRPGIRLLLNLIEDALETGINRVELLRGEEGYKYDFTSENFKNWKIVIRKRGAGKGPDLLFSSFLKAGSMAYKHWIREKRLLKVQYKKGGVVYALPGYLFFRFNSVKNKLGN